MIIKRLYSSQEVVEGLHLYGMYLSEKTPIPVHSRESRNLPVLSRWRILCLLSKAER